jgi:hypothetical protein
VSRYDVGIGDAVFYACGVRIPDTVAVLRLGWGKVHELCESLRSGAGGESGHLAKEELCKYVLRE